MALDTGAISLRGGALSAPSSVSEKPTAAVVDFLPNHRFAPALVSLAALTISFREGHALIQARSAAIDRPDLTYVFGAEKRVRAVKIAEMHNLEADQVRFTSEFVAFSSPKATVRIVPDRASMVDSLNQYGEIDNDDYLVPTGDSRIPYITRVALYELLLFASHFGQSRFLGPNYPSPLGSTDSSQSKAPLVIEIRDGVAAKQTSPDQTISDAMLRLDETDRMSAIGFELAKGFTPLPGAGMYVEGLIPKVFEAVFGPAEVVEEAWLSNVTRASPKYGSAAFEMGRSVAKALPKIAGQVTDYYVEHLRDTAVEKISALKNQYLKNALPATLRYDRRAISSDYSSWKNTQNGRYRSELSQEQARSNEAASRNAQNNARTRREAQLRADAMRQAQARAATQPIMPGPTGYGNARSGAKYGCIETGELGGIQAVCTTSGH